MSRRLVVASGIAAALVAAGPATALLPRGTVRFVDVPVVTVPIAARNFPTTPAHAATVPARVAMLASPEPDQLPGPPAGIDARLVERTSLGDLPRIDAEDRTSLRHYARPSRIDCSRPCVAVLIIGLGLADRLTSRALTLPGPVGLSFSPYAGAATWHARARASGHEALLGLPLEPERFPRDDAGPLTVRAAGVPASLDQAILRVLAAGSGYVALESAAGAFARAPAAFAPLADLLHERGLGLVEVGGDALAAPARQAGLAYVGKSMPIDLDPQPAAIDAALAAVAARALEHGQAMAIAQPLPASFERIAAWIAGLPAHGIGLVPPSVLLQSSAAALATRH